MSQARKDYRAVAKTLNVMYLFGRWGIRFLPSTPGGGHQWVLWIVPKLFSIIPLDGWITDPKEVEHEMRKRGFEL